MSIRRLQIHDAPQSRQSSHGWEPREDWTARWITPSQACPPSFAALFRLRFTLNAPEALAVHVTADQRYRLWLDGAWAARGSERGLVRSWFYESYELDLDKGDHEIAALVWYLAEKAPWAQTTVAPGLLFAAGDDKHHDLLSSGVASWECTVLEGISFIDAAAQIGGSIGAGARVRMEGPASADVLRSPDTRWQTVRTTHPGNSGFRQGATDHIHLLRPSLLPPQRQEPWSGHRARLVCAGEEPRGPLREEANLAGEQMQWNAMLQGDAPLTVPPHTCRRVLIDLGPYCCGYYALTIEQGAASQVTVGWAERLSTEPSTPQAPPDRHGIDGCYFVGIADEYLPDGGEHCYEPLWWMAGRLILIQIETAGQPLTLRSFTITATGYPLETRHRFSSSSAVLDAIAPACLRTLQSCMHETYMDCPYWEQLQYVGDTRLQALLTYAVSADSRLARKALELFRYTLNRSGPFIASNCPSRSGQVIAPFSLWWVCMLHDYAMWVGDAAFVRSLLPLAWWIVDHFGASRNEGGLARSPQGWNYVDSAAFAGGEPPGSEPGGVSAILNWQLVLALGALGELQQWCADSERAALARRLAAELCAACCEAFFDPARGALADDLEHTSFSEHSQSLALLSGTVPERVTVAVERALVTDPGLIRAGPYFSHYVCQALHACGAGGALVDRLTQWKRFVDAGLSTFPEHDIVGRSDCHAWSAHPLYHMLAGICGINPGDFGFETVRIEPCPGPLEHVSGAVAHPAGLIEVSLDTHATSLHAVVTLPNALCGELRWKGKVQPLKGGRQELRM